MAMIRPIRPTDLVALAAFEAKALPNEARARDRLKKERIRPLALGAILEQWIATEDRYTLVATEGLGIRGLISARHRTGIVAWEVDWLMVGHDPGDQPISVDLLEHLSELGSRSGAFRIFLRLAEGSPVIQSAQRAGFFPYMNETLFYREPGAPTDSAEPVEGLRSRIKADEHGLFRLYCATVPQAVRAAEGMTLEEWRSNQEASAGRRREYVCSAQDQIYVWLSLARGGGFSHLQMLLHPEHEAQQDLILRHALSQLGKREPVLTLVPEYQQTLRRALAQEWDFHEVEHYQTLVRQLAARVEEPKLVPAQASFT